MPASQACCISSQKAISALGAVSSGRREMSANGWREPALSNPAKFSREDRERRARFGTFAGAPQLQLYRARCCFMGRALMF
jgi:hypothetical protein